MRGGVDVGVAQHSTIGLLNSSCNQCLRQRDEHFAERSECIACRTTRCLAFVLRSFTLCLFALDDLATRTVDRIAQPAVRVGVRARRSLLRYGQVHELAAEVGAFLPVKQAEVC